jgi:hypothetical protein
LGCLFATKRLAPRKRVQMALEAGQQFSGLVRSPFHFEKL